MAATGGSWKSEYAFGENVVEAAVPRFSRATAGIVKAAFKELGLKTE
jgi:hypothetical protein